VSIRATARLVDQAAGELATKGRGVMGRREHYVEQVIGEFIDQAFCVPPGGPLPADVREELKRLIDHTIDLLELHVSRSAQRSPRQANQHLGVVKQIYALRDAEEHLTQTRRWN
jgi:hypothetical protein